MLALLIVEDFDKGSAESRPNLSRPSTEIDQPITAVVEGRHGAPALGLRFGLVNHDPTLLGLGIAGKFAVRVMKTAHEVKRRSEFLAAAVDDAALGQIVRRELNRDHVAGNDSDKIL